MARRGIIARRRRRRAFNRNSHGRLQNMDELSVDLISETLPSFFQDMDNPYMLANPQIKISFKKAGDSIKLEKIKPDVDRFGIQIKYKQDQDMCMKNLSSESGYLCFTCFPQQQIRLCEACFQPDQHIGHYYKFQGTYNSDYCACGKMSYSQLFQCPKHRLNKVDVEESYFQQQWYTQFEDYIIDLYKSLFEILFYCERRKDMVKIYQDLSQDLRKQIQQSLNELIKSYQFVLNFLIKIMSIKVIVKPSEKYNPRTICENLLDIQFQEIIALGCTKIEFSKQLVYEWVKKGADGDKLSNSLEVSLAKVPGMLEFLIEQNLFPGQNSQYFRSQFQNRGSKILHDGKTFYQYYLESLEKSMKPKQFFRFLIHRKKTLNCHSSVYKYILKEIFQFILGRKTSKKNIKENLEVQKKESENNEREKSESLSNQEAKDNQHPGQDDEANDEHDEANDEHDEANDEHDDEANDEHDDEANDEHDEANDEHDDEANDEHDDEINDEDDEANDEDDEANDEDDDEEIQSKMSSNDSSSEQKCEIQNFSDSSQQENNQKSSSGFLLEIDSKSQRNKLKKQFKIKYLQDHFSDINSYILATVNGNINQIVNIQQIMSELGFEDDIIDRYLWACFYSIKDKSYINVFEEVFFLFLGLNSPNKSQLFQKFIKRIIKGRGKQTVRCLGAFFELINKSVELGLQSYNYTDKSQANNQKIETYFKQYIYQFKRLSVSDLSSFKYNQTAFGNLENASKILIENCTFIPNQDDPEEGQFIYTSLQEYPSFLMKLFIGVDQISQRNFITYSDKPVISQQPIIQQVIRQILSQECIFTKLHELFKKEFADVKNNRKDKELYKDEAIFFMYYYLLVLVHHFGDPKSTGCSSIIKEIRESGNLIQGYSQYTDTNKIKRLLSISPSQLTIVKNKVNEEKEKQQLKEIKEKGKRKMNKIKQKFNKRNKNLFELHRAVSLEISPANQDLCLLCKEPSKPNNLLAYLACINKNKTLSYSIFGENNVSRVFLSTCFHCIHIMCYTKIDKNKGFFPCMLCQKQSNCLIPRNFDRQNNREFKLCTNILISNFVYNYNCIEVESLFMLLFKHLIESKGLHIFSLGPRRAKREQFLKKVDVFVEQLLQQIYEQSRSTERDEYIKDMEEFINQINKCQKQNLRQIQFLLADTLRRKIINKEKTVNPKKLQALRNCLNSTDFQIFKSEIQKVIDHPLPQQVSNRQDIPSLVFEPKKLPLTSSGLPEFGDKFCCICKTKIKYSVCLICGVSLCEDCHNKQSHKAQHKQRIFQFINSEGEVHLQNGNQSNTQYVYKSAFNIFLNDISFSNNTHRDEYLLQEREMQGLIKMFYEE